MFQDDAPPPPLGEDLAGFDIPKPKPSCRPSLQYWSVSSFSCETIKGRGATFARGKRSRQALNTLVGSRRLIRIFKRRPTRYTCRMPRCILVTLILSVFKITMIMMSIMMSIFTILIMRSGLVAIFKRRLEGYGRSECASKLCQEDGIPTKQQASG